jgi:hypothetical protein
MIMMARSIRIGVCRLILTGVLLSYLRSQKFSAPLMAVTERTYKLQLKITNIFIELRIPDGDKTCLINCIC